MPAVRRAHLDRLGRLTRPDRGRCGSLLNLVFEGNTFRIVIGEPAIGRGLANKHLQVFLVANVLARIDVNQDGHRGSGLLCITRSFGMSKLFARFVKDESGATAIEYGLIAAGIALAIIAIVNGLGTNLNEKFTSINTSLK